MGEKTNGFVFSKMTFLKNKNSSLSLELFFFKIRDFFCSGVFLKKALFSKTSENERSIFFVNKNEKNTKIDIFDFFRNLEISRKKKERDAEEAVR